MIDIRLSATYYPTMTAKLGISLDHHGSHTKVLASLSENDVAVGEPRQVDSWIQTDALAIEFGLDPKFTEWDDGTLAWCDEHWGAVPT